MGGVAAVLVAVLVSGTVFADADGDGLLSAGDEPVAGAAVARRARRTRANRVISASTDVEAKGP